MKYVIESPKTVEQAGADLETAATRHQFGVLNVLDLKATLEQKGVAFPHECRIYSICNPKIAAHVLEEDMSLNMALPCRISIYEEGGRTKIGMIPPQMMLSILAKSATLDQAAHEVEETMIAIIDEAK
jgi:uncharacterized protein (DUF302 family)